MHKRLQELMKNPNIAADLKEDKLEEIGRLVLEGYTTDLDSKREWQDTADKILKIAKLTCEPKTKPFASGSANIKYPLIPTAILQYASRTYPEIVRDGKVVGAAVIGQDADGEKGKRARRISEHMSYQLLIESPNWEEHMDRLLHVYAAIGTCFKKTYYDPIKQLNQSILCLPDKIIINNHVTSLDEAPRVTHVLEQSTNSLLENMRAELYNEIPATELKDLLEVNQDYHEILEQHRWLDLDDDGYEEPYVVTYHKKLGKVLRIVARFDPEGIVYNSKDQVVSIKPVQYFTDFHCIPSPDGNYYSMGLGTLLLHPNEVVNSLSNCLLDSGKLANMQGGIIGHDLDIPGGLQSFEPGEWKRARSMNGQALKDQIVPINYKEPSDVLYKLFVSMIEATKNLSSVTDIQTGSQSASDVKATTIGILAEEGKKVFSAMQRRLNRSLRLEFEKLYRLNRIYLPEQTYYRIMDDERAVFRQDYEDKEIDIKPVADPNLSDDSQRMAKANMLMQMINLPGINVQEIEMRMFEAMKVPSPEKLIMPPQEPPPDPAMVKIQVDAQIAQAEQQLRAQELQLKEKELQIKAIETDSNSGKAKMDAINKAAQTAALEHETAMKQADLELRRQQAEKKHSVDVGNIALKHMSLKNPSGGTDNGTK